MRVKGARVFRAASSGPGNAIALSLRLWSINFQIKGREPAPPGVHILGDFIFGPVTAPAGIFIFESGGLLSGIEVYGLAGDAPAQLPRKETLRHFSAGGRVIEGLGSHVELAFSGRSPVSTRHLRAVSL